MGLNAAWVPETKQNLLLLPTKPLRPLSLINRFYQPTASVMIISCFCPWNLLWRVFLCACVSNLQDEPGLQVRGVVAFVHLPAKLRVKFNVSVSQPHRDLPSDYLRSLLPLTCSRQVSVNVNGWKMIALLSSYSLWSRSCTSLSSQFFSLNWLDRSESFFFRLWRLLGWFHMLRDSHNDL